MKQKVLFFIFFILISCQTSNNINKQQSKASEIQEKPEIDKIKIPPKNDESQNSKIDKDIDEESKESNVVSDKNKTKQTINKKEKSNNDQNYIEISKMKISEYDLKEIEIEVNKELSISLKNQDWKIISINPNLIKFLKQDNYQENTLFQFRTYTPATINIVFTRDDIENKIIFRQSYKIKVLPKSKLIEKDKKNENVIIEKNVTEKKEKALYENEEDKRIKELADKYFNEKNYKDAKILFLQLLNKEILDPEIYYKLGIIEKENANTAQAYSYFKSALEVKENPFYLNALIELLKLLKDQKKYKEAIDIYFKYYRTNDKIDKKTLEELYLLLADLYYIMKDYNNSSNEYNRFIKLFPYSKYSAKALYYFACSLMNLPVNPDFEEAYRIFKIVIDQYPDTEYYLLSKDKILYLDRHYLKVH